MTRVLIWSENLWPSVGGIEHSALQLSSSLYERGYAVELVTFVAAQRKFPSISVFGLHSLLYEEWGSEQFLGWVIRGFDCVIACSEVVLEAALDAHAQCAAAG